LSSGGSSGVNNSSYHEIAKASSSSDSSTEENNHDDNNRKDLSEPMITTPSVSQYDESNAIFSSLTEDSHPSSFNIHKTRNYSYNEINTRNTTDMKKTVINTTNAAIMNSYNNIQQNSQEPSLSLSILDERTKLFLKIRKFKVLLGKCIYYASINNLNHFQQLLSQASLVSMKEEEHQIELESNNDSNCQIETSSKTNKECNLPMMLASDPSTVTNHSNHNWQLNEVLSRSFQLSEFIQILVSNIMKWEHDYDHN
jgi:hypothetical protein